MKIKQIMDKIKMRNMSIIAGSGTGYISWYMRSAGLNS